MSNFADSIEAGEDEFGGKTEWEDALIKHGIIGAPEKKETEDERALEAAERYQNRDRLAGKTLEQLDELEDEEDEDVLDKYRQARLAQLKEQQARNRFGEYRQIAEPDFVGEVSKAGDDVFVVLHLFVHGKQECKLLHQILERLAVKFKYVKFLRIVSTECIHNYPDRNCPTVLIYNKGDIVRQIVGLELFGGLKANADTVEWVLARSSVLTSELEDDPREALKTVVNRGSAALGRRGGFNDDEDDDDYDD